MAWLICLPKQISMKISKFEIIIIKLVFAYILN